MAERLVLLVDDHTDTLDLYSEYLTFHGHEVVVASHGEEAITLARAKLPAVVFLDIETQRAEALRAGFDEFIAKPCLPDALMAAVERLLKTERPA